MLAAFVATLRLSRRSPQSARPAGGFGFAVGQAVALGVSFSGADTWQPSRNLEWVPWIGLLAGLLGPALAATELARFERFCLALFVTFSASLVLVPDWPDLWPARTWSIATLTALTTLLTASLIALAKHLSPRLITVVFAATGLFAALLIAATFSLTIGEDVLSLAAALTGVAAAVFLHPRQETAAGLVPAFTITLGGWCYVTAIEPQAPALPLWPLLLIPVTPLGLALLFLAPLRRLNRGPKTAVAGVILLSMLAGIAAWQWSRLPEGEPSETATTS